MADLPPGGPIAQQPAALLPETREFSVTRNSPMTIAIVVGKNRPEPKRKTRDCAAIPFPREGF
jgi:hypothetical protein